MRWFMPLLTWMVVMATGRDPLAMMDEDALYGHARNDELGRLVLDLQQELRAALDHKKLQMDQVADQMDESRLQILQSFEDEKLAHDQLVVQVQHHLDDARVEIRQEMQLLQHDIVQKWQHVKANVTRMQQETLEAMQRVVRRRNQLVQNEKRLQTMKELYRLQQELYQAEQQAKEQRLTSIQVREPEPEQQQQQIQDHEPVREDHHQEQQPVQVDEPVHDDHHQEQQPVQVDEPVHDDHHQEQQPVQHHPEQKREEEPLVIVQLQDKPRHGNAVTQRFQQLMMRMVWIGVVGFVVWKAAKVSLQKHYRHQRNAAAKTVIASRQTGSSSRRSVGSRPASTTRVTRRAAAGSIIYSEYLTPPRTTRGTAATTTTTEAPTTLTTDE